MIETDGMYLTVSDEEILQAIPKLARGAGVFAEPAGAAAYAGLIKAVNNGDVSSAETIVVLNTGNGLKDIASAMKAIENTGSKPYTSTPDLDSFKSLTANISFQRKKND